MERIAAAALQAALLLLLAPLLQGFIKRIKAGLQCRRGPGVAQPYYDLAKYMRKENVVSEHASWLFNLAPYAVFAATVAAGLLLPVVAAAPLGLAGDAIALAGLLGLARFLLAAAALEPGSAFGGMGSSREVAIAATVEPALLLALFSFATRAGTTDLAGIMAALLGQTPSSAVASTAHVLAVIALVIVAIAETGRIPVDNPDTHLELTMIHEGMLLEYAGRPLGLLLWAAWVKQLLVLGLLANLAFPWGLATSLGPASLCLGLLLFVAKVFGLGALLAVIETAYAKMRLFRVPDLVGASFVLSLLALVSSTILEV